MQFLGIIHHDFIYFFSADGHSCNLFWSWTADTQVFLDTFLELHYSFFALHLVCLNTNTLFDDWSGVWMMFE